jgi:hypothetical protein
VVKWNRELKMSKCFFMIDETLKDITKRSGERVSPYITPHLQWIVFPVTPFKSTNEVLVLKMIFIQFIQLGPKPLSDMISSIA